METVELRVHGVHGTSPGAMLGVADGDVGQVAGDDLTGIYRVKDGKLPYRNLEATKVSVEAYSWGALTSGVKGVLGWVKRALWLLLLPFALVNLAYWARLQLGKETGQARWGTRAVRASGLLLTVFFILTPCVLAIDLVAWQCFRYGIPGCSGVPSQLNFMTGWQPGQRIALATLVPIGAVALLWLLSRTSLSRYESTNDPDDNPPPSSHVLLHPKLWEGTRRTLRLQRSHLIAGIATVIAFSGIHVLRAGDMHLPGAGFKARELWAVLLFATVTVALVLLVVTLLLVLVTHEDDVEPLPANAFGLALGNSVRSRSESFDTWLLRSAVVVYALHVLALAMSHHALGREATQATNFNGRNVWFIAVFVGLTVLHISVFVGGRMQTVPAIMVVFVAAAGPAWLGWMHLHGDYDETDSRMIVFAVIVGLGFWLLLALWQYKVPGAAHADEAWRGAGASVLLAAAAWIALLFTTSTVIAAANYLNGPSSGVGDLVSTVVVDPDEHPRLWGSAQWANRLPREHNPASTTSYAATGGITVRHGRVIIEGDEIQITSGSVEMKTLATLQVKGEQTRSGAVTDHQGRTKVREDAQLVVPGRHLTVADSCVNGSGKCTAESTGFRPAGVIDMPEPGEGPTIVKVGNGVTLQPSLDPEAALAVPQVLIWTPIAQLVWLLVTIIAIAVCIGLYSARVKPQIKAMVVGPNGDPAIPKRDRGRSAKARQGAGLAHRAETLLDVVGAITSPIALATVVASISGAPPWSLPHGGWTREVATAAMYVVLAMSAGLILLGSQIRRSEKTRKAVGVIWDLTTFWPRAAHPLAPPCYAERVVPELNIRTRWVLDKPAPPNLVILSGHSQGSLIVLSMAARLQPEYLARIRMITYGSQIRALYGRVFPRVFGPDAIGYQPTTGQPSLLTGFPDVPATTGPPTPGPPVPPPGSFRERLATSKGQWVNLFRRSDPLGWRVFSDKDSALDLPVPEVPRVDVGDPGPAVMGHSGYQHTLVYRVQLMQWTYEPLVDDPPGTSDLPTLPPL